MTTASDPIRKNTVKTQLPFALAGALALASAAAGQDGPVTSNLKNVLVYVYGYTGDHGNTVHSAGHLIKLGQSNGFAVDTTRSHSVFTPANLAKYQAVVLFNAYNFGGALAAS
jgi:hypothetical protein